MKHPGPRTTYRYESNGRVVVVGDVHGHYPGLLRLLRSARLIDDHLEWTGGDATLVQLGDVFGRGDHGKLCAELLMSLERQAAEHGGRVITLLGNHEAMITHDHLKYVTPAELMNFSQGLASAGDPLEVFRETVSWAKPLGTWLRSLPIAVVVDGVLFVHGGLEWEWAQFGLNWLNTQSLADMGLEGTYRRLPLLSPIASRTGPLWNRRLIEDNAPETCDEFERVLAAIDADAMVVGHTPTAFVHGGRPGRIVKRFDGQLVGVDVGIHPIFGGHCRWLEVVDGVMRETDPETAPVRVQMPEVIRA